MATWNVMGVHRTTGATVSLVIQAGSQEEARIIGGKSIFVERVEPGLEEVFRLGYDGTAARPLKAASPNRMTPRYTALWLASSATSIVGGVIIGFGLIALVTAIVRSFNSEDVLSLESLPVGLESIVSGIVCFSFGQLLAAVRDIARNSYHQ